jgi:polar amino acid transport system substrate-binding protein
LSIFERLADLGRKLMVVFKHGILISFAVGILVVNASAWAESLPLATGEWVPYTSRRMEGYGTFTRRVDIVFQEMGIKPDYRFFPWQRCYDAVINGGVWAIFPYSYTEERARKVWFSEVLSCSKTLFFYYDAGESITRNSVTRLEDLKSYRLGGVRGYFYEELFRKKGIAVDYVNKEINAIEKLKLGRIDIVPMNDRVGWNLITAHFPDDRKRFKTLALPLSVNSLRLMVSRDYPGSKEFLDRFNRALTLCIQKGLLAIEPCESDFGLMK